MTDPNFTTLAIKTAINEMVRGGFFSICVIDRIIETTGAIPNGDAYRALRLLHCVKFMDMPPKILEGLPDMIRACINGPTLEICITLQPATPSVSEFRVVEAHEVEVAPAAKSHGWLRGLLK